MRNAISWVAICAAMLLQSSIAFADTGKCQMQDGYLDEGIGGTGYSQAPGGDDGIGGTGISATEERAAAKPATVYVIGTIYAYGSICVNGLRIEYSGDMPVEDGGKAKELAIGALVEVVAETVPGSLSLRAREIALLSPLEGPVTGIDIQNNTLEVLGEKLTVKGLPSQPSIAVGDIVRLSGLRNLSDEVIATSIERVEGVAGAGKVEGDFGTGSDGRNFIGKTPVVLPEGMLKPGAGEEVEAIGEWRNNALHLSRISEHEEDGYTEGYISIEGYVESAGDKSHAKICDEVFDLQGLKEAKFSEGDRVVIKASINKEGKMSAIGMKPVLLPAPQIYGSKVKDK